MLGIAVLTLLVAHAGGSSGWTSSTTLLQDLTEDNFRGRVFSAEFAFTMLTLAAASFTAGSWLMAGCRGRTVAAGTGLVMLLPACSGSVRAVYGSVKRNSVSSLYPSTDNVIL
jgi:hypothetical protein